MESITQLSWTEASYLGKNANSYFERFLHLLNVADNTPAWPDAFGTALHEWINQSFRTPIRTLSLFSGGGGLDIAFHDAGFRITHMIEIDSRYVDTLTLNSRSSRRLEGGKPLCIDIKNFEPPDDLKVDFIIGDPPCQTFSACRTKSRRSFWI